MAGLDFSFDLLEPVGCAERPGIETTHLEQERLAVTVEQCVWHATAAAVKNLRIEFEGGELVLAGRCRTYYVKQVAQQAAMAAAPGWNVCNRIAVT